MLICDARPKIAAASSRHVLLYMPLLLLAPLLLNAIERVFRFAVRYEARDARSSS